MDSTQLQQSTVSGSQPAAPAQDGLQYFAPLPTTSNNGNHEEQSRPSTSSSAQSFASVSSNGSATSWEGKRRGQRVLDYERAAAAASSASAGRAAVFQVRPSSSMATQKVFLYDLPNEILANIVSHLHLNSIVPVSLVSRRFYHLVNSPHPWMGAFDRRFLPSKIPRPIDHLELPPFHSHWDKDTADMHQKRSTHSFARLTDKATWCSEFSQRSRMLQSLSRGQPRRHVQGDDDKAGPASLTYASNLGWSISHLDVNFASEQIGMAIHGTAAIGRSTASSPSSGKPWTWGGKDKFSTHQWNFSRVGGAMYGLGSGPTVAPNCIDVSNVFGMVAGEGFPGGRLHYRGTSQQQGRALARSAGVPDATVPVVPANLEGISSLWLAKSTAVPDITQSAVGIMTGSTLGVITTYSLGNNNDPKSFTCGAMTAQWVVCAGVPIVALKVDDSYNDRRKSLGRVWAVALNALGEVYYLCGPPQVVSDAATHCPWRAGRSVPWLLIDASRRQPTSRVDPSTATFSPVFSHDALNESPETLATEARVMEFYLTRPPSWFLSACRGWDMRRRLEVDFGADDGHFAGEAVFVVDYANKGHRRPRFRRYARPADGANVPPPPLDPHGQPTVSKIMRYWYTATLKMDGDYGATTTASALDSSTLASQTLFEAAAQRGVEDRYGAVADLASEMPGGRARFLAIGFDNGVVSVWNGRDAGHTASELAPLRIIKTDSPKITCLAVSSLFVAHGGSDGRAQAWDPLGSIMNPIRMLNPPSSAARFAKQLKKVGQRLEQEITPAVGAIFLDPNPTSLRGVVAFGPLIRSWSYRAGDIGPLYKQPRQQAQAEPSRRHHAFSGHIQSERVELQRQKLSLQNEQARLNKRFGVGLAGLTENEVVGYAQAVSEETYALETEIRSVGEELRAVMEANRARTAPTTTASTFAAPQPAPNESPVDPGDVEFAIQLQHATMLSLREENENFRTLGYEFSVNFNSKKRGNRSRKPPSPPLSSSSSSDPEGSPCPEGFSPDRSAEEEEEETEERQAAVLWALENSPFGGDDVDSSGGGSSEASRWSAKEKGKGKGKAVDGGGVGLGIVFEEDDFPPLGSGPVAKKKGGSSVWR